MTKEEIIEMAQRCGLFGIRPYPDGTYSEALEDFAKLIAAQTLMKIDPSSFMSYQEGFEAGQLAEREECAKVCENSVEYAGDTLAEAIRARGQ